MSSISKHIKVNRNHFDGFRRKLNFTRSIEEEYGLLITQDPGAIIVDPNDKNAMAYVELARKHNYQHTIQTYVLSNVTERTSIHKTWVNIPLFLKEISNVSRGEQHRQVNRLITGLKDRWEDTKMFNTNKDVVKLMRLFKALNVMSDLHFDRNDRDNKFARAQMFNTMKYFVSGTANQDLESITSNIQKTSQKIDNVMDMYHELANSLYTYINNVIQWSNLALITAKTIAFSYLLTTIEKTKSQIIALLTLLLPSQVSAGLNYLAQQLIRAVETAKSYFNQPRGQIDNDTSIFGAFFQLIKGLFSSLFTGIDRDAFENMKINVKKITILSDLIRASTTIWDFILKVITYIIDFITQHAIKLQGYLPSFVRTFVPTGETKIETFLNEYEQLSQDNEFEKCTISTHSAKRVIECLNAGRKLEVEIYQESLEANPTFYDWKILPLLRLCIVQLQKVTNDIPPHIRNGFEGFRKKPFWIYIHGRTNIAKSSVIQPTIASCLAARLGLVDVYDDPHNYSYFRTCGAKYFNKYNKQPIIQYQDLFQNYANEEAMHEAIMELTNIVDEAPYELNMADVESKGKYFCVSDIVISNAQKDIIGQQFLANKCWSNGAHIYRRRNIVIEPVPNKKYLDKNNNIDFDYVNAQVSQQCPVSRYVDFIPADLYDIKFTHPVSGNVIQSLKYDDAITYILDEAEKHYASQNSMHEKLNASLQRSFNNIQKAKEFKKKNIKFISNSGQHVQIHTTMSQPIPFNVVNSNNVNIIKAQMFNSWYEDYYCPNCYVSGNCVCLKRGRIKVDLQHEVSEFFPSIHHGMRVAKPRYLSIEFVNSYIDDMVKYFSASPWLMMIQRGHSYVTYTSTFAFEDDTPQVPLMHDYHDFIYIPHAQMLNNNTVEGQKVATQLLDLQPLINTLPYEFREPFGQQVDKVAIDALENSKTDVINGGLFRWVKSKISYFANLRDNGYINALMIDRVKNMYTNNVNSIQPPDNPFFDAQCDCFETWDQALRLHPLLINNTDMANAIRDLLAKRHNDLCQIFHNKPDQIITHLFIELMYDNIVNVPTSNLNPTIQLFIRGFKNVLTVLQSGIEQMFNIGASLYRDVKYTCQSLVPFSPQYNFMWRYHPCIQALITLGTTFVLTSLAIRGISGFLSVITKFRNSNTNDIIVGERQIDKSSVIEEEVPYAQTDEGNRKAKKVRIRRKLVNKDDNVASAHYDVTNRNIEEVVRQNIVTFRLVTVSGEEIIDENLYMHGLCVGGSTFVLPRHFWNFAKQTFGKNVMLQIVWINNTTINVPFENISVYIPQQDYLIDIIFIRIKRLCSKRSIVHFFLSAEDDVDSHEAYIYGRRSHTSLGNITASSVDGVSLIAIDYIVDDNNSKTHGLLKGQIVKSPLAYKYYNSKTIGGDCGAILMFVNPKLNSRVLAGMHIAGITHLNIGYSAPIYQEDVLDAIEAFDKESSEVVATLPIFGQIDTNTLTTLGNEMRDEGFNVIGSTGKINNKLVNLTISRKSKIKPSLCIDRIIEELGPNTCAPARLRPFVKNGEVISPLFKAYAKLGRMMPNMVPNSIYDQILQHCSLSIETWHSPYTTGNSLRRVLTDYETVNGCVGLKQIDLSTSPGFPYSVECKTGGKKEWFKQIDNTFQYDMGDLVKKRLDERIGLARKGIKAETYYVDTLKDEPRPIEKVEEGKTRLFQVAPMDLNLAIRKYFGAFIAHMSMTFLDGESAIGVNCLSEEWDLMFKDFKLPYDFDLDSKDFDASTGHQIGMFLADLTNKFYDDGPENAKIRETLIATNMEALHIVGDVILESLQGNKSGVAVTTHQNNSTNKFIMRLAYFVMYMSLYNYHKQVKNKFYGDDVGGNTSLKEFNCDNISQILKHIGFQITTGSKGKDTEFTFLKRKHFHHPDLNKRVGCLDKAVIQEIPRWCESDPNNMRDQMNRFNSALLEAALHGRGYFDKIHRVWLLCCLDLIQSHYQIDPNELFTYDICLKIMFPNVAKFNLTDKFLQIPPFDSERLVKIEELILQCNENSN